MLIFTSERKLLEGSTVHGMFRSDDRQGWGLEEKFDHFLIASSRHYYHMYNCVVNLPGKVTGHATGLLQAHGLIKTLCHTPKRELPGHGYRWHLLARQETESGLALFPTCIDKGTTSLSLTNVSDPSGPVATLLVIRGGN